MKKILVLLMSLVFFVAACNNKKTGKNQNVNNRDKDDYGKNDNRNTDENNNNKDEFNQSNSWSNSDIRSFNEQCLTTVNNNEEIAKSFCPCLLEKFQNKYSSLAEMDRKASEEEGKSVAEECMALIKGNNDNNTNVSRGWPQSEKDAFISNCVTNAMAKGNGRSLAQNYCDCMLNKMETLFPDINDAARLTDEDLESPAMKKMISDCKGGD